MCCVEGHYEWLRSPDEYLKNEMMLVDLDAGTTYEVRVVAKNGDGYEASGTWLAFHTPGVGESTFASCHQFVLLCLLHTTQCHLNFYKFVIQVRFMWFKICSC